MKKNVFTVLAATAIAAAAVAIAAPSTAQAAAADTSIDEWTGVVKISAAAGAQVYSDSNLTQPIKGKVLPKGSRWQYTQRFLYLGDPIAVNLGGHQYVKAAATSMESAYVTDTKGTFTVNVTNHPTWATVLYNKDLKPIRSLKAKSSWKVYGFYAVYYDGQAGKPYSDQFYDLGNHQYVKLGSLPDSTYALPNVVNGTFHLNS